MKKIRVEDGVGTVLAHDMTRIVPGRFQRGWAFYFRFDNSSECF
jgi:hypothetical protein